MTIKPFHRITASAMLLLGILLQPGCKRIYEDQTKLQSAADSHRATFTEVDRLHISTGPISGGGGGIRTSDPTEQVYVDDTGRKVPKQYYAIYCDIYWRMNWIRTQLRNGTIPEDFTKKLDSVRKELRDATVGLTHDGNYKVADEALTYLESGWQHFQAHQDLVDAGARISAAPFSVGTIAMQQYIDSGAFGFGERSLANSPIGPQPAGRGAPANAIDGMLDDGSTKQLTPMQTRAIQVALRYAGDYHREPKECAQQDWSMAVQKINRLRDQLWLMNKPNNKDNSTIVDVTGASTPTAVDPERISSGYTRNGTDLPNMSGPVGDPFQRPAARSASSLDKPRSGDE